MQHHRRDHAIHVEVFGFVLVVMISMVEDYIVFLNLVITRSGFTVGERGRTGMV